MNETSHQTELPLTNQTVNHAMPEEVIAECRQIIGQILREVLLAEKKEVKNEQ